VRVASIGLPILTMLIPRHGGMEDPTRERLGCAEAFIDWVVVSSPIRTRRDFSGRPMPAARHSHRCMISRVVRAVLLALLALIATQDQVSGDRGHARPYFMPPVERDGLHGLISKDAWAEADHARLKRAASTGDGFAAAFLYALDGDPRDAAIAQQWLLGKYGKKAYWTVRAAERLNGEFFKGGQVGHPRGVLRR
jgi:hypothetical protein